MSDNGRVVIVGGHGKVALLAASRLADAGYAVQSLIRNPDHADDVRAARGEPVVLDIESASVDELVEAFTDASAVVFSAGAGGGNPARTKAVDHEAAVRAVDAAERAGVRRFVMVSFAGADSVADGLDPSDAFYPYAAAKKAADEHLRQSSLDYTILGPGALTLTEATERIRVVDDGADRTGEQARETSRANVAAAITHVVAQGAGVRETIDFYDGDTPIADAIH